MNQRLGRTQVIVFGLNDIDDVWTDVLIFSWRKYERLYIDQSHFLTSLLLIQLWRSVAYLQQGARNDALSFKLSGWFARTCDWFQKSAFLQSGFLCRGSIRLNLALSVPAKCEYENRIYMYLTILFDLFWMVKWPFQKLSALQPGDQKVTLNQLLHWKQTFQVFARFFVLCHSWTSVFHRIDHDSGVSTTTISTISTISNKVVATSCRWSNWSGASSHGLKKSFDVSRFLKRQVVMWRKTCYPTS